MIKVAEIVQICSWCQPKKIRVLNRVPLARGEGLDFKMSKETGLAIAVTRIRLGSEEETFLQLSHGICPECKAKFMAKRVAAAPAPAAVSELAERRER